MFRIKISSSTVFFCGWKIKKNLFWFLFQRSTRNTADQYDSGWPPETRARSRNPDCPPDWLDSGRRRSGSRAATSNETTKNDPEKSSDAITATRWIGLRSGIGSESGFRPATGRSSFSSTEKIADRLPKLFPGRNYFRSSSSTDLPCRSRPSGNINNIYPKIDRQTDRQTDKQIGSQWDGQTETERWTTNWRKDRQKGKQPYRQTRRQTDRFRKANKHTYRERDRQTGKQTYREKQTQADRKKKFKDNWKWTS